MIAKVCRKGATSFKCRAIAMTPGLEHIGFVAYASVEVIGLHAALWWVSLLLMTSGAGAIIYNKIVEEA